MILQWRVSQTHTHESNCSKVLVDFLFFYLSSELLQSSIIASVEAHECYHCLPTLQMTATDPAADNDEQRTVKSVGAAHMSGK